MSDPVRAQFSPAAWWARLGPAGLVTLASIGVAWAAIVTLVTGHLRASVLLALCAFVLDMVDGLVARRTGSASDFGRMIDSLADLVNYSVWSALAAVLWIAPGPWGVAAGALILMGGATRLARFTVDGFDDGPVRYYRGVVTPHLTLAAMVLLLVGSRVDVPVWIAGAVLCVLAVAQLMGFRLRKTGRQLWWASLVVPLAVGACWWLT